MTDQSTLSPSERTREEVIAALRRAITTASNDDETMPGTDKRSRYVDRYEAMQDAIEFLAAPPVREPSEEEIDAALKTMVAWSCAGSSYRDIVRAALKAARAVTPAQRQTE